MSVDIDSFDGYCAVYEEDVRRARKDHRCDACGEPIRRGELYSATRSLFDGSWDTTYRCARCDAMYRCLSEMLPADQVCAREFDCGHTYEENFSEPPPLHLAALAFLTPAEGQLLFRLAPRGTFGPFEPETRRIERVLGRILSRSIAA